MPSAIEGMFTLVVVFLMIYVGWVILEPVNPLLAILFVLMGLYLAFRSIGGGGRR